MLTPKEIALMVIDAIFICVIAVAAYYVVTFQPLFWTSQPYSFITTTIQVFFLYACIRLRLVSEVIPRDSLLKFNFYAFLYSILNTIYEALFITVTFSL